MRMLQVDIDELADAFTVNQNEGQEGFLNVKDGSVYIRFPLAGDDFAPEDLDDPDTWVHVPSMEAREQFRIMEDFARDAADPDYRQDLLEALDGKGAFSRFRRAVSVRRDLEQAWYDFRSRRVEEEARQWLASIGLEAPPSKRRSAAPLPQPQRQPELSLVDLLLFGVDGGVTDGVALRTLQLPQRDHARRCFNQLARSICEYSGEPWRRRFVEARDDFERGRFKLEVRDTRVELRIEFDPQVRTMFEQSKSKLS